MHLDGAATLDCVAAVHHRLAVGRIVGGRTRTGAAGPVVGIPDRALFEALGAQPFDLSDHLLPLDTDREELASQRASDLALARIHRDRHVAVSKVRDGRAALGLNEDTSCEHGEEQRRREEPHASVIAPDCDSVKPECSRREHTVTGR